MYFENVKCRVSEARALKRTSKKVKKKMSCNYGLCFFSCVDPQWVKSLSYE